MEAVKQNGYALRFASVKLKNNYDLVMEAVKQSEYALEYASAELQENEILLRVQEELHTIF